MTTFKTSISLFVSVLALAFANASVACDCATLSIEERVGYADVIFTATITEYHALKRVAFAVDEVFKGEIVAKPSLNFKRLSDCDYFLPPVAPKPGDEYLIFGQFEEHDDKYYLIVSRCLGSAPLIDSENALAYLEKDQTRDSMIPCTPSQVPAPENNAEPTDDTDANDELGTKTSSSSLPSPAATL